jgi:hypothetical protein
MTTTMNRLHSLLRRRIAHLAGAMAMVFVGLSGTSSRADVLGTCDALSDLITCAATDVGKPCQGGGKCLAVPCSQGQLGSSPTMVYKCDACPTIVATPAGTCTYSNMGSACGGGDGGAADAGAGTCSIISPQCQTDLGTGKLECQNPAAAQPTGPPAGEGGGGSGGLGAAGSGAGGSSTAGSGAGGSSAAGSGAGGSSTAGSTSSSGCDIAPKPPKPTQIGLGLVAAGLVIFVIDRARRRSR